MIAGLCELMWLRTLLTELQLYDDAPLQLYCDNQAAINIINDPVHHDRTKHVEIDIHFIKEKLDEGALQVSFVKSVDQLADVLTKGVRVRLVRVLFCFCFRKAEKTNQRVIFHSKKQKNNLLFVVQFSK